jgi:phage/plasmid-associated DNA primase
MIGGNVAKVEELYKTTLQFTINFKIMITSNLMPKFKPDKGIKRRGVVCEFKIILHQTRDKLMEHQYLKLKM